MRTLAAAVLERLDGYDDLKAFDGEVPIGTDIYATFYLSTPLGRAERLSADHALGLVRLATMSVGGSPNECRWAAERVHAALTGHRIVTGASPTRLGTAGQVRKDDDATPPAWVCTDVWNFHIRSTHA